MADYTVTVVDDDEYALAYAQEIQAKNWSPEVPEGEEPPPPPPLAQTPQVLVEADLRNRLLDMQNQANAVLPTLQAISDPTIQQQVLQSLVPSPAVQAYITSKL